jgi:hypothetical protein
LKYSTTKNPDENNNCIFCRNWSGQAIVENNHLAYEEKFQFWLIDGNKWYGMGDVKFWHMGAMHPINPKIHSNIKILEKIESSWKEKMIKYFTRIKMSGLEKILMVS